MKIYDNHVNAVSVPPWNSYWCNVSHITPPPPLPTPTPHLKENSGSLELKVRHGFTFRRYNALVIGFHKVGDPGPIWALCRMCISKFLTFPSLFLAKFPQYLTKPLEDAYKDLQGLANLPDCNLMTIKI